MSAGAEGAIKGSYVRVEAKLIPFETKFEGPGVLWSCGPGKLAMTVFTASTSSKTMDGQVPIAVWFSSLTNSGVQEFLMRRNVVKLQKPQPDYPMEQERMF